MRQVTAIVEREGNGYVALCPEVDVASQGDTIESAVRICKKLWSYFLKLQITPKSNDAATPNFSSHSLRSSSDHPGG
jgi:predicted RNase H-like HicB family nuclease